MPKKPRNQTGRILPEHINTNEHFWNSFGHMETEVSARLIVKLCQKKGGWTPFTQAELDKMDASGNFVFNGLDTLDFLIPSDQEAWHANRTGSIEQRHRMAGRIAAMTFTVTETFIARCYASSPSRAA